MNAAIDIDYISAINAHYAARNDEERKSPVRLSGLGDCPRSVAIRLTGEKSSPVSPEMQRTWERGHERGASLARALIAELAKRKDGRAATLERACWLPLFAVLDPGKVLARMIEVFGEEDCPIAVRLDVDPASVNTLPRPVLFMRGRADLTLQAAGEVDLLDAKSKNSYGFTFIKVDDPDYGYTMQLYGYRAALEHEGLKVRSMALIYENEGKDRNGPDDMTLKLVPVDLEAHRGKFDECVARLCATLNDFAKGAEFNPLRAPAVHADGVEGALPWPCNYCPVGPERGQCVPFERLGDERKPGANVPKWIVGGVK